MKTKALFLSALILAPTAGAAAVQIAPAQDFRVSYKSLQTTAPSIFIKSNLPQALSDTELDEVTGEGPLTGIAGGLIGGIGGALIYGIDQVRAGQKGDAAGFLRAVGLGAAFGSATAYLPLP